MEVVSLKSIVSAYAIPSGHVANVVLTIDGVDRPSTYTVVPGDNAPISKQIAAAMARGEVTLVAPPPVKIIVPPEIKTVQLLRALRAIGKDAQFKAFIAGLTGSMADDWEETYLVRRDDEIAAALATALGMSSSDVDTLFVAAASL